MNLAYIDPGSGSAALQLVAVVIFLLFVALAVTLAVWSFAAPRAERVRAADAG